MLPQGHPREQLLPVARYTFQPTGSGFSVHELNIIAVAKTTILKLDKYEIFKNTN